MPVPAFFLSAIAWVGYFSHARTVSHTVITSCTARGLSSFKIVRNICTGSSPLSRLNLPSTFSSSCFSAFHQLYLFVGLLFFFSFFFNQEGTAELQIIHLCGNSHSHVHWNFNRVKCTDVFIRGLLCSCVSQEAIFSPKPQRVLSPLYLVPEHTQTPASAELFIALGRSGRGQAKS